MPVTKTLSFLPAVFRSDANQKFLNATIDQLVTEPNLQPINGFVGRKFSPGFTTVDSYVKESSALRADYQLEPSVIVKDVTTNDVEFHVTYPEVLQTINYFGGNVANPNGLWGSEYYSYNPHINYDAFINFGQYYWLPNGPAPVDVFANSVDLTQTFYVYPNNGAQVYNLSGFGLINNPELILARGGTYTFKINQPGKPFWIQTDPGTSGKQLININLSSRQVLGVDNNGTDFGDITFTVPEKTDQDTYVELPMFASVDLVTTLSYAQIDGQLLSDIIANYGGIDGQTDNLDGKTFIFGQYYGSDLDWTVGTGMVPVQERYNICQIVLTPDGNGDYIFSVTTNQSVIPTSNKIHITSGVNYGNTDWYKTTISTLEQVPIITAPLDILYYQDGVNPNQVGTIRLVDVSNTQIDVVTDILGKLNYISPNGVTFTNGLKIQFDSSVTPSEYQNNQYYVDGVGTGITLTLVSNLTVNYATAETNYDPTLYYVETATSVLSSTKDQLTITTDNNIIDSNVSYGQFPNDNNPYYITPQDKTYNYPYRSGQDTQGDHTSIVYKTDSIGVTYTGIPINGVNNGWYIPGTGGSNWYYDTNQVLINGQDAYGGYVDPEGFYIYRDSTFITANAWANVTGFTGGMIDSSGHSKIIGFAKDGYPIYGPWGYDDPTDANSSIVKMTTSYSVSSNAVSRPGSQTITVSANVLTGNTITISSTFGLNPGMRITTNDAGITSGNLWIVNNGLKTAVGPSEYSYGTNQITLNANIETELPLGLLAGSTLTFEFLPGAFIEDYAYEPGLGHLDQFNGRYCVTPDFPNGTYAYFASQDISGTPTYPYFVGRAFYGSTEIDTNTSLTTPDYITINRSSRDINPWTRRNRWFHKNVIDATSIYNKTVAVFDQDYRAKRPIIEFNPNFQLFDFGKNGLAPVDLFDTTTTEPFLTVEGSTEALIDGIYVAEGMRLIFSADQDPDTRGKIWVVNFVNETTTNPSDPKVIHLTLATDGNVIAQDTISVKNGLTNINKNYYYTGELWNEGQTKDSLNQAPLFDVFDSADISFGDTTVYPKTSTTDSFNGCKIFSYSEGTGTPDPVLGFPLTYKNFNNVGDIQFSNNFDTDTFVYTIDKVDYTKNVNTGFLHLNNADGSFTNYNVWTTVVQNSRQYQDLSYIYDGINNLFTVDIIPETTTTLPNLVVYVNFKILDSSKYQLVVLPSNKIQLIINPSSIKDKDKIDVLIYSNQISKLGYFQIPDNLNYNAQNANLINPTLGELRNHVTQLTENSLNFVGVFPGPCNLRDIDVSAQGGTILQQSSPTTYASMFLTSDRYNFADSLFYAQQEYTKFKNKFLSLSTTVNLPNYSSLVDVVDDIIKKINLVKNSSFPWFYSGMVPYGDSKNTITYNIFDTSERNYEITSIYNPRALNNKAILIYLNGSQLLYSIDYTFLTTAPGVTILPNVTLNVNDTLVIQEYTNTDGNWIPETPTKLGIYPKFTPEIYVDNTYQTPTEMLRGHDGSLTPTFGDFRDTLLLELERRIYNNIKVDYDPALYNIYDSKPGKFRDTGFTIADFNRLVSKSYLRWIGTNKLNYTQNNTFESGDAFTFNYGNNAAYDVVNQEPLPGSWRSCFEYFYDTQHPDSRPWEMLGFSEQPDWWEERYGTAPYTSGNQILWEDLEAGYIANGNRAGIDLRFARPGLSNFIPVDVYGNLLPPLGLLTQKYDRNKFDSNWLTGQWSPTETAWRNSSEYPYAAMMVAAITNPARFFALSIAPQKYRYNSELKQYLVTDTNYRLTPSDVDLNGYVNSNGTIDRSVGFLNWIVDYTTSLGILNKDDLLNFVRNYKIQLSYRMAGFSGKQYLKALATQNSPNSQNDSVIIPDSDFDIVLGKSTPTGNPRYSAVIVEKTADGFSVSGYDTDHPYFTVVPPELNGSSAIISVGNSTARFYTEFKTFSINIPYGTTFTTTQELVGFLASYQRWLVAQGFRFNYYDSDLGDIRNWQLSSKEFLLWAQQGWNAGNLIVLGPFANRLEFFNPRSVVDEISNTFNGTKVVTQNFVTLDNDAYSVVRDGNEFRVTIDANNGDMIGLADLNLVQYEHVIIFNNTTQFNDIIYDPSTGQRQYRLKLVGHRTGGWTGTLSAQGFIYNAPGVQSWVSNTDYLKSDLVEYKNFYYAASRDLPGTPEFNFPDWLPVDKNKIKTGLLNNFATNAGLGVNFYDIDTVNLEDKFDTFGLGLIGYRNRDYLNDLGLDDTTQVKFYQGFIKEKGTLNAINAMGRVAFNGQESNVSIKEQWGFRVGTYGSLETNQYVELTVNEDYALNNPVSIQAFGNLSVNYGSLYNYIGGVYKTANPNWQPPFLLNRTVDSYRASDIQTAGFVNIDDVDYTIFNLNDTSTLSTQINNLGVGKIIWTAIDFNKDWNVYRVDRTPSSITKISNALNNKLLVTTNLYHNLTVDDVILMDTNDVFSGIYKVLGTPSLTSFLIEVNDVPKSFNQRDYLSSILNKLTSLRFNYATEIIDNTPAGGWTANSKVWVDYDADGWAVYNKSEPWTPYNSLPKNITIQNGNFGSSVILSSDRNFAVVGEPNSNTTGSIINYKIGPNGQLNEDITVTSIVGGTLSLGASMSGGNDLFVVGAPDSDSGTGYVFVYSRDFQGGITQEQVLAPTAVSSLTPTISFGTSVAISNDDQWLYVGAPGNSEVYVYAYDNFVEEGVQTFTANGTGTNFTVTSFTVDSGEFIIAINSIGEQLIYPTHFSVSGNIISFNSPPPSGTLVIRQTKGFRLITTLTSGVINEFGYSVACATDGSQVIISAPSANVTVGTDTYPNAGYIEIYDRSINNYITQSGQTSFSITRPIAQLNKLYVNNELQMYGVNYIISAGGYQIDFQPGYYPTAGSIVKVETNEFSLIEKNVANTPRTGSRFGQSVDMCSNNCSIYVGAPYESSGSFYSGAVYRFLNQGRIYGTILGTVQNPTVTAGDSLIINNFEVTFPLDITLDYVVSRINSANVPGISAVNLDGYLQINSTNLVNTNKLSILPGVGTVIDDLGLDVYIETQKIENPTNKAYDYFGETVKVNNNSDVLVVGSSSAITIQATTFDVASGYPTTFDGDSTTFHDDTPSGAVWILSYVSDTRVGIEYPGIFAFVQQLTMNSLDNATMLPYTKFGAAFDIVDNELLVGAPIDYSITAGGGAVYQFNNIDNLLGWDVYRSEEPKVDISSILKAYLYSKSNQSIIDTLDYIDPAKGKILGVAEQEISFKTDYDPATYNNSTIDTVSSSNVFHWNDSQVGQVWWDLSAVKYIDYEQSSIKYRTANWGRTFPGSTIDVYEWVESLYPPSQYVNNGGLGVPKYEDNSAYATKIYVDPATNVSTILYYFWVKNKDSVDLNQFGRQIPTTTITEYIRNPKNSGIKFFAAIRDDSISLYNIVGDLTGTDVVYHLDYATKLNSNIIHSEYALISENDSTSDVIPENIYNKLVDSLSGSDTFGNPVPDVRLPVQSRYGIDIRPRQSMFIDNRSAIEQMVDFVNSVFAKNIITQGYDLSGLVGGEPYPPGAPTTVAWAPNTYYTKDQIISYNYTAYIVLNNFVSGTVFNQGLNLIEYFYYDLMVANIEELGYINVAALPTGYKVLVESNSEVNGMWTVYTLQSDSTWLLSQVESYRTSDYWNYVDWYAEGFDNTVRPDYTINTISDIVNLPLQNSEIVKVLNNGQGKWTLLQVFPNTVITIGIQDGTIELDTSLYTGYGFDIENFDSDRFDQSPSIELRKILDALQNNIFINQLSPEFVSLFFVFIYYVLDEQKYIDWAFKTSFIDVVQKVAGLDQPQLYNRDNQNYYRQYIEEVKPYHTTIKEYVIDYEGVDNFNGYATDFDLPAYWDPVLQMYRSPSGEFAEDIRALQQPQYRDWILNYTYVIDSIDIVDGGSGYIVAPIVTITGSTIGNDAVAKAYISNGIVTRIDVLYSGTNYVTQPVITFDGGSTTPAQAYARLTNGKVRNIKTTLVYDRITYGTQVAAWTANTTYTQGSLLEYAGSAYIVNTTFTSGNTFVGSNLTVYPAYKLSSANDRIQSYYDPETGLPGKSFDLLQPGISYPGVTVDGLKFDESRILDANIESYYTDTELGTRPEDIIIDGGAYVDPYSSHAPEELIPGRTFDTLDMTVTTFATDCTTSSYADWVANTAFYVSDILILDGGEGYSSDDVAITISGGQAHVQATIGNILLDSNGVVISASVTSPGYGYVEFPTVTITGSNSSVASASVRLLPSDAPSSSEPYPTFSYRIVKTLNTLYIDPLNASGDSNVTYSFYKIDANSTTTLSSNLGLADTEISVTDASVLFDPQPENNIPGVVYINGERITYWQRFTANNTLGQIRRGTGGTGAIEHLISSNVVDASLIQIVPLSAPTAKSFDANTIDITTSGKTYEFLVGNTYVQSLIWLNQGFTGQDIVEEYVGNVNVNVIITEDSISLTTDDDLYPSPADGRGLYNSTKVQAVFVRG